MKKFDKWHLLLGIGFVLASEVAGLFVFLALHYADLVRRIMEQPHVVLIP